MDFLMVRQDRSECVHKPAPTVKTSVQFCDFEEPYRYGSQTWQLH